MVDKIFKIGLLVLGFLYLAYLFCPISNQVGRYQYNEDIESLTVTVFDTTNADLYLFTNGKWIKHSSPFNSSR